MQPQVLHTDTRHAPGVSASVLASHGSITAATAARRVDHVSRQVLCTSSRHALTPSRHLMLLSRNVWLCFCVALLKLNRS